MKKLFPKFLSKRLDPLQRYGLRLTLFIVSVSLVGIPFAFLLIEVTRAGQIVRYDQFLAERVFAIKLQHDWVAGVFNFVSLLGSPVWFWFLIGGLSIYLWVRRLPRLVAYLLSCTIGGSIVNTAVKVAVNRERPTFRDPEAITFQEGKSFPSGHAMSSMIAYGAILLVFLPIIPKRWRLAARIGVVVLVLAIGISRLALGVHYMSDVLGGYLLGLAWLTAATAAFETWRVERGRKPGEPIKEGVEPEAAPSLSPGEG